METLKRCVDISQLSFRWPGASEDLLNISQLVIQQGESVFIHGASGSGKSTLLNLLTGVLTPTHGNITILDKNITKTGKAKHDSFRADHFGIIFQQFNLIPYLTVIENILLPLSFSKYRQAKVDNNGPSTHDHASELLSSLGLNSQDIFNRNITELSTGQQQRIATARALIGSPEIIIADEPTSALDSDAKHGFIELLFNQVEKTNSTLIFVSHDLSLATMFNSTIPMKQFTSGSIS
ncbi:MAG: ABC transporter ATP-binding protein [Gammaproteobacteria bacterium]